MDILIGSSDARAINYLRHKFAVEVDPLNNLWGLSAGSISETLSDLAELAPGARGWAAAVTDFTTFTSISEQNPRQAI